MVSLYGVKDGIKNAIINSLNHWDGINYIKKCLEERNHRVIIKPNFSGGIKDKPGAQTSYNVLSAIINILQRYRQRCKNYNCRKWVNILIWNIEALLTGSIYQKLFKEKNMDFVNLSKQETVKYNFGRKSGRESIPKILLEPDFFKG